MISCDSICTARLTSAPDALSPERPHPDCGRSLDRDFTLPSHGHLRRTATLIMTGMELQESAPPAVPSEELRPIAANERIEALDVVRGFALLGIFLMNIEFFNRTFASFDEGMPRGLTGLDWLASWFIAYFVQGKFWTIFSLLFGMGFAVMMVRAEQAGREFKKVYLRRVLALAAFGAAHFILLWQGDILFSYAVAALMLMVVLYGKPKPIFLAIALAAGVGFFPKLHTVFAVAGGIAAGGLVALYLRSANTREHPRARCAALFVPAAVDLSLLIVAAVVFWVLPDGPVGPRLPLSVFGPLLLIAGWLSWKYYEPADRRSVRLAVSLYLFFGIAITTAGVVQRFAPDPDAGVAIAGQNPAMRRARAPPAGEKQKRRASATNLLKPPSYRLRGFGSRRNPMKARPSGQEGRRQENEDQGRTRRGTQGRAGQGPRRVERGKGKGATDLQRWRLLGNGQVECRPVPGKSR